jgi:hypothetical protein
MSSELSTLDHEAASYIAQEREGMAMRSKSSWEKAKQWVADVQIVRIPSVPIFKWLPKYSLRQQFSGDLNAGLACAVLLIPQGMAYGIQLGIPVIHGLYSAIFFGLVYAVMGTSRETCPANTGKCREKPLVFFFGGCCMGGEDVGGFPCASSVEVACSLSFSFIPPFILLLLVISSNQST